MPTPESEACLRRALPTLAILVLALIPVVTVGSAPASAHAALVSSDPEDGSTLAAAPATITLMFNEDIVAPAFMAVTAPDGSTVTTTDIRAKDATVTAALEEVGKRGRFSASYRVVSTDGHPIEGTFHYTITSGETVRKSVERAEVPGETFLDRHATELMWGAGVAVVAAGLLVPPLRRRSDQDDA